MKYMPRRTWAVAAMMISLASLNSSATGPSSTEAERQHAIELAKWLEEHPLDEEAKVKNTELLEWWTEVPDLKVNWCAGLLLEQKNKRASFVVLQSIFGAGAYLIRHPEAVDDRQAIAIAGVESTLRAYGRAKGVEPKVEDKFLRT